MAWLNHINLDVDFANKWYGEKHLIEVVNFKVFTKPYVYSILV